MDNSDISKDNYNLNTCEKNCNFIKINGMRFPILIVTVIFTISVVVSLQWGKRLLVEVGL